MDTRFTDGTPLTFFASLLACDLGQLDVTGSRAESRRHGVGQDRSIRG